MEKVRKKKDYYAAWFVFPALILFLIFFVIPNLASFVLGFTDWSLFFLDDMHWNGIENFKRLFHEPLFWKCMFNTFYFACVTVVVKNILGFFLALIVKETSRFNNFVRAVAFLPVTMSSIVVGIIFVSIYNPTHGVLNGFFSAIGLGGLRQDWLFNTKISLSAICAMEIWQQSGFNMCIFVAGMQGISKDYYDAAAIDGASYWQQVRYVTLPLIVQSFTVTLILNLVGGIKVFSQVYGTTNGGPAGATEVLSTFLYKNFGYGYLGYSAAVGLFTTVLIIAVSAGLLLYMRGKEVGA